MPTTRNPHKGSMQYWHRARARRPFPRVRTWPASDTAKPLGFAGYKAGMTHAIILDKGPNSPTKNEHIFVPLTILECPPLSVFGYTAYATTPYGKQKKCQVLSNKFDKNLSRAIPLPKKTTDAASPESKAPPLEGVTDIMLLVHTQPATTGVHKKTPEIFEIGLGGKSIPDKLQLATSLLGKTISITDVFSEGQQVDTHLVTKGKGYQGPVKRFGVSLRSHKSEKGVRGPGNVGSWTGNRSWTVAHAGQHGYHTRTEYNKWLVKIDTNTTGINPSGGIPHYGVVNNPYILLKGSVGGPAKRLIRLSPARRPNTHIPKEAPLITSIATQPIRP